MVESFGEEAAEGDVVTIEEAGDEPGVVECVGVITVEAEGGDLGVGEEAGELVLDEGGVFEGCAWLAAGDEGAVGSVSAIDEAFAVEGRRIGEFRGDGVEDAAGHGEERDGAEAVGGEEDSAGDFGIGLGLVVECAMGFEEGDRGAQGLDEHVEGVDLIEDEGLDLSSGESAGDATELGAIGVARVGAEGDAAFERGGGGGADGVGISGVEAAGEGSGGDMGEDGEIPGAAFAEVGVHVDAVE